MSDEISQEARTRPARLVIADDHALVRKGMRSMLDGEPGLEVVGEAANGREALELCHRLRPDLVLMDVRMPKMDGLEATRAIKREFPLTAVLMVTMHENIDYLLEALKAGAAGYVLKESSEEEVTSAVRQALDGESPLNPALAAQLLRRLASEEKEHLEEERPPTGPKQRPESPPESLTPREVEVLRLLAQGLTNREIAQKLVVSPLTVKVHVQNIIGKLRVSDRTQAAVRAVQLGLLASEAG
jgi:DNA-binding NarL/FixJ family response regulator